MLKKIAQISQAQQATDGVGVSLKRNALFHGRLDPFLMLDEIKASPNDQVGAFPVHPHRGIQTLSYVIDGAMAHQDSIGNQSEVKSGGIQWMHTGQGIEHAETPKVDRNGLWSFQFWLNVPRLEKYQPPQYQDVISTQLPWQAIGALQVKGIAGKISLTANQKNHQIKSDFDRLAGQGTLADMDWQGSQTLQIQTNDLSVGIYIIAGNVKINQQAEVQMGDFIEFTIDSKAEQIEITGDQGARLLFFSGNPIGEPIVHQGPFVMTTQEEIRETLQAYRDGTLVAQA